MTCGPGGYLDEYVPFYFGRRSPMLYTISRGNVEGYEEGQNPIVYCVSTAQAAQAAGLGFVFTDGHGVMDFTDFFDDLADLDEVDWPLMEARYWFDTDRDPDRKRRRQAEFLVYQRFPWELIEEIGTVSQSVRRTVEGIVESSQHSPLVDVRRAWYY